ncbi:MAG: endonuclease domain-containing protein [Sideroxydans sp.]|nr:endonuclease domain-containing protein [Sideroxydans sp.]
MKGKKPNPSQPPLVRGGAERQVANDCERIDEAQHHSSPDKGRPGGVRGFIPYNNKLTALARQNRKNPTAPEIKMWNEVLRMRHFSDYKFLRQKPIAGYIVDFYCAELCLAIEIDGDSHAESVEYDAARTAALDALGITVVRYTNDDVMRNLEGVYDDLLDKLKRWFHTAYHTAK